MVLVGPSGCGKSTLLRMIAGLEEITDGTISIGDRDVTELPPPERDIAMVFQNYALYPHMNVRENLGFGLSVRHTPKPEIRRRVDEVATLLGLEQLLERKPAHLSGGQRQRVAMGRAIIREPVAFLMDEPLSNLDAKLRVGMRASLAELHARLSVTSIYVTHDQTEAMTLGQRVAVMRDGRIVQVDLPQRLYQSPNDLFVAAFIGSPSMNLVEAAVDGSTLRFGSTALELPASSIPAAGNGRVILGIRPTDFEHGDGADTHLPRVRVSPEVVEDLGSEQHVIFTIDAPPVATESVLAAADVQDEDEGKLFADIERSSFTACLDARRRVAPGSELDLAVDPARLHFFEPASGEALQRTMAAVPA
jgi:multiple sugar transport system ATP-binding protein